MNNIKVRSNGPLLCTGDIEIYDANGNLLEEAEDIALCRCGASHNKPFCDGSHRDCGFSHPGMLTGIVSDELEGGGALQINVRANAMLVVKGPMKILNADGSCAGTRNKAALCRCGHSGNKPFCDGSHKAHPFED
ncbi:MAG: CDGSH iron-sulfur domain-containing protein [Thiogranum sp.]|nr:CDGSH iron-sulfur domain-containing protein [Thiogranum sp.]